MAAAGHWRRVFSARPGAGLPDPSWDWGIPAEDSRVDAAVSLLAADGMTCTEWDALWQLLPVARAWGLEIANTLDAMRRRRESEVHRHWGAQRDNQASVALHV